MKPLCLDVGNVLGSVRFEEFVTAISVFKNIRETEAHERINIYQGMHDIGIITMREILIKEFGIYSRAIRSEIIDNWLNIFTLDSYMVNFFDELAEKHNVNLALLSNVGHEHAQSIDSQLRFLENNPFTKVVKYYSCYVGARKPSKLYYHSFLQMHPEFKGAVYVDDNSDNLDSAREFGFITVRLDLLTMDKQEVEAKLASIRSLVLCC